MRPRPGPDLPKRGFSGLPRSPAEALEPARAPDAPRKQSGGFSRLQPLFSFLNGAITFLLVGLISLAALIWFVKFQFDRPGPLDYSTVMVIPKGEGLRAIASRLEREGIISDNLLFTVSVSYFKWFGKSKKLRAGLKYGEYEFKKGASMRNVLDTLLEGKQIFHKITFPEGLTSRQIVSRLRSQKLLKGRVTRIPPEGSLLPDTYKFSRGTPRIDILKRMETAQRNFLDKVWKSRRRGLPIQTTQEAVILASIVEKETGRADERSKIAGVFINRLRKKMRLQSDPTIIYGLAGGKGTLGRPILRSEITQSTPYNTYQIDGLPPTPIANPGRASIEAVLNPDKTKALYFVADGTGGHKFSETLKDHNRGVAKWREIERRLRAKQKAEAAAKQAAQTQQQQQTQKQAIPVLPGQTAGSEKVAPGLVVSTEDLLRSTPQKKTEINTTAQPQSQNAPPAESLTSEPMPLPSRRPR